jgi:hypothetical protein
MAALRRRLLNLLTAGSLLLCAAVVALWVRSCFVGDSWDWATRTGRAGVDSCRGSLSMGRVDVPAAELATIPRGTLFRSKAAGRAGAERMKPAWSLAGFAVVRFDFRGMRVRELRVPFWALALATGVAPAASVRRRLRTPLPAGSCPRCGYDLRATPERCPECGSRAGAA